MTIVIMLLISYILSVLSIFLLIYKNGLYATDRTKNVIRKLIYIHCLASIFLTPYTQRHIPKIVPLILMAVTRSTVEVEKMYDTLGKIILSIVLSSSLFLISSILH